QLAQRNGSQIGEPLGHGAEGGRFAWITRLFSSKLWHRGEPAQPRRLRIIRLDAGEDGEDPLLEAALDDGAIGSQVAHGLEERMLFVRVGGVVGNIEQAIVGTLEKR